MNESRPKVGVGITVIKKQNGKRYIMLHQRKGSHGSGYWGSGGGHLELGESLEEGALRELAEEAGDNLEIKNITFLSVVNFTEMAPKHYLDLSFTAEWVSGEPKNTEPEKTSEWQWFDLDDLPEPLFPPVKRYVEALKTGKVFFDSSSTSD